MSETPYLNLGFKILWRDTTIATKNPTDPPRSDKTHKAFLRIRHIFCSIFIHQHENKNQNIDYEQPNDRSKFHAYPFKSVLTTQTLPLGFLERERKQNFKIDSQIYSFTKVKTGCFNMIFGLLASSPYFLTLPLPCFFKASLNYYTTPPINTTRPSTKP